MRVDDITDLMLKFREAVRHSWNAFFTDASSPMSPDIQSAFDLMEQGFFQGIVLDGCDLSDETIKYRRAPLPFVHVVPRPEILELFVSIGQKNPRGVAWKAPAPLQLAKEDQLEFVRFFDWNPYEQISMSLVEVRIAKMSSHPELVDARGLIEAHEVRFLLASDTPSEATQ